MCSLSDIMSSFRTFTTTPKCHIYKPNGINIFQNLIQFIYFLNTVTKTKNVTLKFTL